jgi:hypothetical protein
VSDSRQGISQQRRRPPVALVLTGSKKKLFGAASRSLEVGEMEQALGERAAGLLRELKQAQGGASLPPYNVRGSRPAIATMNY